jgi:hypothetical protein
MYCWVILLISGWQLFFVSVGLYYLGYSERSRKKVWSWRKERGVFEARGNFYHEIDGAQTLTGGVLCL